MMVDDLMMMINDDWWLYPLVNKQFATENDAVEIEDFPIENSDFPAWKWPYNWNPPGSTREHGHRNSWYIQYTSKKWGFCCKIMMIYL